MAKVRNLQRLTGSVGETTFLKAGKGPNYRVQDKLVIPRSEIKAAFRLPIYVETCLNSILILTGKMICDFCNSTGREC